VARLPGFFHPHRILQADVFVWRTLVPALLTTWLFFAVWNSTAVAKIESTFEAGQLQDFRDVTTNEQAADRVIELKWADPKLRAWLREVMKAPSGAFTARQQAVAIFQSTGSGGPSEKERNDLMCAVATRQRQPGVPAPLLERGFWVKVKAPTAAELFNSQAALQDGHWRRAVEAANPALADEKKKFAQRYMDAFAAEMNEPVRDMRRLNGWVQWLTIFLACTIVTAAFRRWLLINKLAVSAQRARDEVASTRTIGPHTVAPATSEIAVILQRLTPGAGKAPGATEEVLKLRESADAAIYGLFASLAAAIPALGFLGTVIGMSAALLHADGLFSSQDKQRVVGQITQGLGFAFDATLVSLVCAPIAVIFQAAVRVSEQRMFARWVGVLHELRS
jgi:biopolymer transport protein ExbB/TolQ